MSTLRNNTLVLDTSVLPKRPKVSEVKNFMDNILKLDMTKVKRIQLHNLKNVVRLGMTSLEVAEQVASNHHMKHFMECEGTQVMIPIPIYVESSAVDVRVFDLPEDISDGTIKSFFSKYGEVICIRDEAWKNFFPGFANGVKVIKIKLLLPIPSIVTVEGEATLVQYRNQPKVTKPTEASSTAENKAPNQQQMKQKNKSRCAETKPSSVASETQWPSLSPSSTEEKNENGQKPDLNKRQRSVEEENNEAKKKPCTQQQDNDDNGSNSMATRLKQRIEKLERGGCYDYELDPKKRGRLLLAQARQELHYEDLIKKR